MLNSDDELDAGKQGAPDLNLDGVDYMHHEIIKQQAASTTKKQKKANKRVAKAQMKGKKEKNSYAGK